MNETLIKQIDELIAKLQKLASTVDSVDKDQTLAKRLESIASSLQNLGKTNLDKPVAELETLKVVAGEVTTAMETISKVKLTPQTEPIRKELDNLGKQISTTIREFEKLAQTTFVPKTKPRPLATLSEEEKAITQKLGDFARGTSTYIKDVDPNNKVSKQLENIAKLFDKITKEGELSTASAEKLVSAVAKLDQVTSRTRKNPLSSASQQELNTFLAQVKPTTALIEEQLRNAPKQAPLQAPKFDDSALKTELDVLREKTIAVKGLLEGLAKSGINAGGNQEFSRRIEVSTSELVAKTKEALAVLDEERNRLLALGQSTGEVDRNIAVLSSALNILTTAGDKTSASFGRMAEKLNEFLQAARKGQSTRIQIPLVGEGGESSRLSSGTLAGTRFNEIKSATEAVRKALEETDKLPKGLEGLGAAVQPAIAKMEALSASIRSVDKNSAFAEQLDRIANGLRLIASGQGDVNLIKELQGAVKGLSKEVVSLSEVSPETGKKLLGDLAPLYQDITKINTALFDLLDTLKAIQGASSLIRLNPQAPNVVSGQGVDLNRPKFVPEPPIERNVNEYLNTLRGQVEEEDKLLNGRNSLRKELEDDYINTNKRELQRLEEIQDAEIRAQAAANEAMLQQIRKRNEEMRRASIAGRNPTTYMNELGNLPTENQIDQDIRDLRGTIEDNDEYLRQQRLQNLAEDREFSATENQIMRDRIAAKEKALQEEKRLQARMKLGSLLPGGEAAFARLNEQARRIDPSYVPENIKNVSIEPTTGIARVNYEMQTADGIFKRTTFTVDRFGNVLVDTQKRFRSLAGGIVRDMAEFAKWGVAMAIVLAPLAKINEMTQTMIKQQAQLAEVNIALGDSQRDVNEVFTASAQIARETGESLSGVLDAYNQAYRATGGIASATERFATSNKLLKDSITLASLSTLDQAESIDILSAALKQTRRNLQDGDELLNKWVAVSKVANVDLTALATSFSVLGDAAINAGLNTDELNTVIALLSEASSMTGREVANAARAIVAGFETDKAREQLSALGISMEKSSGEAKNFLELVNEVNQMRLSGIISPEQFGQLANAIGQGSRRGAIVATLFTQLGDEEKVSRIMDASTKATKETGEAQSALGLKLDIVDKALVNLGNSFEELARTLGTKGGLLDVFAKLVELADFFVRSIDKITSGLGRSGPILATFLTAVAYLKATGRYQGTGEAIRIGMSGIPMGLANMGIGNYNPGNSPIGPYPNMITNSFNAGPNSMANSLKRGLYNNAGIIGGFAGALISPVEGLVSQGLNKETGTKFVASVVGGILGGLATGGAPIGIMIGSAIADGFATSVLDFKPELKDFFKDIVTPPEKTEVPTPKQLAEMTPEERVKELSQIGASKVGQTSLTVQTGAFNLMGQAQKLFGKEPGFQGVTEAQTLLYMLEQASKGNLGGSRRYDSPEKRAEFKALADQLRLALQEANAPTAVGEQQAEDIKNVFEEYINEAIRKEQEVLQKKLASGEMTTTSYKQASEGLTSSFSALSSGYYGAFGQGQEPQPFFDVVARIQAEGKTEELATLTKYKEQINALDADLAKLTQGTDAYNQKLAEKNRAVSEAVGVMDRLNTAVLSTATTLKNVDLSDLGVDELAIAIQLGKQAWEEYIQANILAGKITVEQADAMRKAIEPLLVLTKTGYQQVMLPSEWLQAGVQKGQDQGIITKTKDVGFSSIDMTQAQYQAATSGYEKLKGELTALGYKADESQSSIVITKDGFMTEHRDSKIIQYLLQQIEKNTKEMSGAYNLPEGAGFFVPYDATKLMNQNQGGGTGGFSAPGGTTTTTTPINYVPKPTPSIYEETAADRKMAKWEEKLYGNLDKIPDNDMTKFKKQDDKNLYSYEYSSRKFQEAERSTWGDKIDTTNSILREILGVIQQPFPKGLVANSPNAQGQAEQAGADWFTNLLTKLPFPGMTPVGPNFTGAGAGLGIGPTQDIFGGTQSTGAIQALSSIVDSIKNFSAKLSLQIDNRTTVQLDGRVIASVVKQYLKNDMLRFGAGGGTVKPISPI